MTEDLPWPPPRVIGRYPEAPGEGPTLVVFGGIHGNEPAGVFAARRVAARLAELAPPMRGQFVALAGNRPALARGVRFLDRDLNRAWTPAALARLRDQGPDPAIAEEREQLEILTELGPLLARRAPLTIFDMHTTSATGPPFCGMEDSPRNRRLAVHLPIPLIIGLDELVFGAMLAHLHRLGHTGVSIEAGEHDDPETVERLVSALWLLLCALGLLAPQFVDGGLTRHRQRLVAATAGLPRVVDACYRHRITPPEQFVMNPGHTTFSRVVRGQVIARDRDGPIAAPFTGRLLMPLYQPWGDDGFFLARELSRPRLWLANLLGIPLRRPGRLSRQPG